MDKIARVRQEIERQMKFYDEKERELLDDPKQFTYALFYQGHQKMCAKLLSFLDTLSEEPDKSLEEAAEKGANEYYVDNGCSPFPNTEKASYISGFIAGSEWQAEQLKK